MDALNHATGGMEMYRNWLDVYAHHVAHADEASVISGQAYRSEATQVGATARALGVAPEPGAGQGYVRADVDLSQQMAAMTMAERSVDTNAAMSKHAQDAYAAVLAMGSH